MHEVKLIYYKLYNNKSINYITIKTQAKMAFVRTFLVNIIPNEITIEQFRDSMEYLGSICRIDKTPYLADNKQTILGWNAFVYYESWKSTEATQLIDKHLANPRRRNVLCFIDPSGNTTTGTIDTELHTPTITVHSLNHVDFHKQPIKLRYWLLSRNTSNQQYAYIPNDETNSHKLIRFIPEQYNLRITIPNKNRGSHHKDSYILNKIQQLKLGDISYIEKSRALYNKNAPSMKHDTVVSVHIGRWYVSEFTMKLQERIAQYGIADIIMEFGEDNWMMYRSMNSSDSDLVNDGYETWVRPNKHLYFN